MGLITINPDGTVERTTYARLRQQTPLTAQHQDQLEEIRERLAEDALMAGILEQLIEGSVTERPEWQALERTIERYSVGVRSETYTIGYSLLRRLVDVPAWEGVTDEQLLNDDVLVAPRRFEIQVGPYRVWVSQSVDFGQVNTLRRGRADQFRDLSDAVKIERQSKKHGDGGTYYVASLGMNDAEAQTYDVLRRDGLSIEEATVAAVSLT